MAKIEPMAVPLNLDELINHQRNRPQSLYFTPTAIIRAEKRLLSPTPRYDILRGLLARAMNNRWDIQRDYSKKIVIQPYTI